MSPSSIATATLLLLLSALAPAQNKDVSLETLARAMEGRLGIYAKNLTTGDEIAINADKLFPTWESGILPTAEHAAIPNADRGHDGSETRPLEHSPRKVGGFLAVLHGAIPRNFDSPNRRPFFFQPDRALLGGGLSPTIEIGGKVWTTLPRSPAIVGYAACPAGDMVFCILTTHLDSPFTAGNLLPVIVEACFRRLVPGFVEKPFDPKPQGLLLASLHERDQDPKLFPKLPQASTAESRAGSRRVRFRSGEVARLAVLARPAAATIATVQWWSPAERPESCSSQVLDGVLIGDAIFDQSVDKLGLWRVRVAFGDVIVLDEKFYVTVK